MVFCYTVAKKYKNRIEMDEFLETIGALNDETRLRILYFIKTHGEVCVCDVENSFEMLQSRVSRHLKILKDGGFLTLQRRGKWAYYTIKSDLSPFLSSVFMELERCKPKIPALIHKCKVG